METNNISFCRHIYQLKTSATNYDVYTKVKNSFQASLLPDKVNICSVPGKETRKTPKKQLKVDFESYWPYGKRVTDLNSTQLSNIYEGWLVDPNVKDPFPGSLIFFEFSENSKLLVIDVFQDFYTHNPFTFSLMLSGHKFLLRKKPESKEPRA